MSATTEEMPKPAYAFAKLDTQCVYIDIEVNQQGDMYQAGVAAWQLRRTYPSQEFSEMVEDLERLKPTRPFLCGHNIRRHDKRIIDQRWPDLIKWKIVIDTLELSLLVRVI